MSIQNQALILSKFWFLLHESQTRTGSSQPRDFTLCRCCEQLLHTPAPHARQWWMRTRSLNSHLQHLQLVISESSCQYAGRDDALITSATNVWVFNTLLQTGCQTSVTISSYRLGRRLRKTTLQLRNQSLRRQLVSEPQRLPMQNHLRPIPPL